jgi:hypothetical protein
MGCNCGDKGIKERLLKLASKLESKGDLEESTKLKKSIAQYDRAMKKLRPTKR